MASKKVLIVDDEDNIGRSLRMILEREGYAVAICRSVAEFRKNGDTQRADAFLFDMRLPDGSGIDLLRSLQQNDTRAPAIMSRRICCRVASALITTTGIWRVCGSIRSLSSTSHPGKSGRCRSRRITSGICWRAKSMPI